MTYKHKIAHLLFLVTLVMMVTSVVALPIKRPRTSGSGSSSRSPARRAKLAGNRWQNPCGGSEVADAVSEAVGEYPLIDLNFADTRRSITSRIDLLIKDIDHLKKLYAERRFKDSVQNLDQLGFQLNGVPKPADKPRRPEKTSDWLDLIVDAISDLSSVAPFIESAIDGERTFEHGHHYADHYQKLLDHSKYGLSTILCELTRLRSYLSGGNNNRPAGGAQQTNNLSVVNNAIRHYRDYVVLRDLRKLLHRLRNELRYSLR